MSLNNTVVIVVVVAFAFYLIYSQNNQQKNMMSPQNLALLKAQLAQIPGPNNQSLDRLRQQQVNNQNYPGQNYPNQVPTGNQPPYPPGPARIAPVIAQPAVTNVTIEQNTDPYSDPIKKQDEYSMYDPLTYPQYRLPREVLEKYNEYYERNGVYPPFGQATQPLFDNPTLNGILIKIVDENEPFTDNTPHSVPLFRVKSVKNTNRYFYYVLDQRYLSKVELKIPLDHVKVNGVRYHNADYYGLPELFDDDIIECIPIYPGVRFKVLLYKTYHFP
jgi:hypothetical protein